MLKSEVTLRNGTLLVANSDHHVTSANWWKTVEISGRL